MDAQTLATDIVKKLVKAGYTAYFAGGWVRDYLMGHPSDDIDIATNAPPEKILDLFPYTILVGLAFGVVIVVHEGHQFEVATFRRDVNYVNGRKPEQIELSTPEEDATRRDFTINGMFYDPLENVIHDFVQGAEDLQRKIIRTIGDPYARFDEDRLRMIRAVRFSARFGFAIDFETQEAIRANADFLLPAVAVERIWQELNKMSKYPHFDAALVDLHRLGLLSAIFPRLKTMHLHEIKKQVASFAHYPSGVETIIHLMELFPFASTIEMRELCRYLHTSNADANLAEFFVRLRELSLREGNPSISHRVEWVQAYAHPSAWPYLKVIAASMSEEKREAFLHTHQQFIFSNEPHIRRIAEKKPLVNAALLEEQGIMPGKLMGQLLKEAETIAITEDLHKAASVLEKLKASKLWPASPGE